MKVNRKVIAGGLVAALITLFACYLLIALVLTPSGYPMW